MSVYRIIRMQVNKYNPIIYPYTSVSSVFALVDGSLMFHLISFVVALRSQLSTNSSLNFTFGRRLLPLWYNALYTAQTLKHVVNVIKGVKN